MMEATEMIETRMSRIKEKHDNLRAAYSDEEYIKRLEDSIMAIEFIAMHQEELPKHINTEKEQELHDAMTKIYRMSHSARLPGCMDKHPKWEDELQETIKIASQ